MKIVLHVYLQINEFNVCQKYIQIYVNHQLESTSSFDLRLTVLPYYKYINIFQYYDIYKSTFTTVQHICFLLNLNLIKFYPNYLYLYKYIYKKIRHIKCMYRILLENSINLYFYDRIFSRTRCDTIKQPDRPLVFHRHYLRSIVLDTVDNDDYYLLQFVTELLILGFY